MSAKAIQQQEASQAKATEGLLVLPNPTKNSRIVVIAIIALSAFVLGLGLPLVVHSLLGKQLVYFSFTQILLAGMGLVGGVYLGIKLAKLWANHTIPKLEGARPWEEWVLTEEELRNRSIGPGFHEDVGNEIEDYIEHSFVNGVRAKKADSETFLANLFDQAGFTEEALKEHTKSVKQYLTNRPGSAIQRLLFFIDRHKRTDVKIIKSAPYGWQFIQKRSDRLEIVQFSFIKDCPPFSKIEHFLLETRVNFPFQKDLGTKSVHALNGEKPKLEYRFTPISQKQLRRIIDCLDGANTCPHPATGIDSLSSKVYLGNLFSFDLSKV